MFIIINIDNSYSHIILRLFLTTDGRLQTRYLIWQYALALPMNLFCELGREIFCRV